MTAGQDWRIQARADLEQAERAFKEKAWYVCALFSQQAAEKALKAVFIEENSKLPPKTHDLVQLGTLVHSPQEVLNAGSILTPAYIQSRYPGITPQIPVDFYTVQKASELLTKAKEIVAWTNKKE